MTTTKKSSLGCYVAYSNTSNGPRIEACYGSEVKALRAAVAFGFHVTFLPYGDTLDAHLAAPTAPEMAAPVKGKIVTAQHAEVEGE